MHGDFILWNNFISKYLQMTINNGSLGLTLNKEMVEIPFLQQHKYKCDSGFSPIRKRRNDSYNKSLRRNSLAL